MFKGKCLTDMQKLFTSQPDELPNITPGGDHAVLFQVPLKDINSAPSPYPPRYEDKWDAEHVKMPCSPKNLNQGTSEQNWTLIKRAFQNGISNSIELEEAISSYSSATVKLVGLHKFLNEVITEEEKARFFNHTLPGIVSLALRLPEIVTHPPVLLSRQKEQSISLSQLQIGSLLANAFLSTFPGRNMQTGQSDLVKYPNINFAGLFGYHRDDSAMVPEKIKCFLAYFDEIVANEPTGAVTITRVVIKESEFPKWEMAQETFGGLYISSEGTIEKEGDGLLQMDFADRSIGGLTLDWDCLQEEVLFAIRPEMLIACLFTEILEDNEALLITGCEQYCRYSGYSRTFRFEGNYVDMSPRDDYGRRRSHIVAIDATEYNNRTIQYEKQSFLRELNKAYAGFHSRKEGVPLAAVATGNWGCGVFNGDPRFKSLIQLMAAAVTGRDLAYFSFGDDQLRDDVFSMYSMLLEKKTTVGMLYQIFCQYGKGPKAGVDLYEFIRSSLGKE